MTDIDFRILELKKVPAFQWKNFKKLVFWDDYGRKIERQNLAPTSPLIPLIPVSCLLPQQKDFIQQTLILSTPE
ncbi:hypothetical protein [Okeania sp. KiyG1]|uniref:hypothetical protein n=1 Tax=Okeania sp. KiyG1 TaxID=2720165 RepID=UPI001920A981|nr:hypothetical protein [Okeania sp. KiyG1]